jgi:hypothetical protein
MADTNANAGPNFLPAHLKLKGAENYASWKYHITDILGSKYLDKFILPNAAPPAATAPPAVTTPPAARARPGARVRRPTAAQAAAQAAAPAAA